MKLWRMGLILQTATHMNNTNRNSYKISVKLHSEPIVYDSMIVCVFKVLMWNPVPSVLFSSGLMGKALQKVSSGVCSSWFSFSLFVLLVVVSLLNLV